MEKKSLIILQSDLNNHIDIANQILSIISSQATSLGRFEIIDRNLVTEILAEQKFQLSGMINNENIIEIGKNDGIEGSFSKLIKLNITGLHILNIKSLVENYDLPFAPIPNPKIGTGRLYLEERYNLPIVLLCLIIISGAVFYVGYQSKKQIKEHLTKYEPDSLL